MGRITFVALGVLATGPSFAFYDPPDPISLSVQRGPGAGQRCGSGLCVRDAASCASGCCQGTSGQGGTGSSACGNVGSTCMACTGGTTCVSGECVCRSGYYCTATSSCVGSCTTFPGAAFGCDSSATCVASCRSSCGNTAICTPPGQCIAACSPTCTANTHTCGTAADIKRVNLCTLLVSPLPGVCN